MQLTKKKGKREKRKSTVVFPCKCIRKLKGKGKRKWRERGRNWCGRTLCQALLEGERGREEG
jgi:hypothetical protein